MPNGVLIGVGSGVESGVVLGVAWLGWRGEPVSCVKAKCKLGR